MNIKLKTYNYINQNGNIIKSLSKAIDKKFIKKITKKEFEKKFKNNYLINPFGISTFWHFIPFIGAIIGIYTYIQFTFISYKGFDEKKIIEELDIDEKF